MHTGRGRDNSEADQDVEHERTGFFDSLPFESCALLAVDASFFEELIDDDLHGRILL